MTAAGVRGEAVAEAYRHCLGVARRHYENFPVASHALPAALRGPVAAIYAFARMADDFADEGELDPADRLARIEACAEDLRALERGEAAPRQPVFVALLDVHRRFALPLQPLHDLLRAFATDVTKRRYRTFDELLGYCRCSAQPVGRLLLHLYRHDDAESLARSDAVCTALQLANFLQDMAQDYDENGRIYLPEEDLERFGVTEAHFAARRTDEAMRSLVAFEIGRVRDLLASGAPLAWRLPGRMGFELRMVLFGVQAVLERLALERHDLFRRPRLGRTDWLRLGWRAATARRF
jgi:squalene synthase HpnC